MHAFISYLRANASEVDRLASDLRANGVTVWLDRERIAPGEVWQESIRTAIRSGAQFIACFSVEYERRDTTYMDEEVAIAMDEMRARGGGSWFLPVRLSPCDLSTRVAGWTGALSSLQWVDLWDNWDRGVRQVLDVITGDGASHHHLRSAPLAGSDPYAGTTNDQLLEKLVQYSNEGSALDVAGRHEEAADRFAQAVRIWESIERYRLGSFDRSLFFINSFSTHFNLTLSLYKNHQRLRAFNEAVKTAKRYSALLRQGEAGVGPRVLEAAERQAEALMSIGRELLRVTPPDQRLEGHRVYAAILEQLGDANPVSFRHYQGLALRGLALAALEKNLKREADRSMTRAIEVLRQALEIQGEAVLRDLGSAMRDAIDSFGQEHLRPEYDELVRREVAYISRSSSLNRR
jgi:hypothetical protein